MEAINLYLKAGLPAKAARLALSKEVRIFCWYFFSLNQNLSVKRRGKDFEFNSIGFVRIYGKNLVKSILFVNFVNVNIVFGHQELIHSSELPERIAGALLKGGLYEQVGV